MRGRTSRSSARCGGSRTRSSGASAEPIQRSCRGQGQHELGRERPAFLEHDPRGSSAGTISNERTLREDVRDPASIEAMLCSLCQRVCWRARRRGVKARTAALKLRYADFQTLLRARSITPTCSELELYPVIRALFDRSEPLHRAMDGIRARYGYAALRITLAASQREPE